MRRGKTKVWPSILMAAMVVAGISPAVESAAQSAAEQSTEQSAEEFDGAGEADAAADKTDGEEEAEDAAVKKADTLSQNNSAKESASEENSIQTASLETSSDAAASLTEVSLAPGRTIGTNLLSSFNTDFEGAGSDGAVYWWNDRSWKQELVKRTAYGDVTAPSASCGSYYLKVMPGGNKEKAQAQVCSSKIAGLMPAGATYEYTYYVKLADDTAEGNVTLSVNSVSSDWSSVKSAAITKDKEETLGRNSWTAVSGTITIPQNEKEDQVQIQFTGTEGASYCIDSLTIGAVKSGEETKKDIEWDIPDLKDTISSADGIGSDGYTGVAIMSSEISDDALMNLVTKHFNAVTFGNELKMDCLFGYHDGNKTNPGTEKISFTFADGTTDDSFEVPKLDFSRPESMLNKLKTWNDAHPDSVIKVRGHVLVWHSQAPEWFFHENWDASQPYVSSDVMNRRLEWYIATVLQHFTGSDSPYKDMFYGWDVVNEAVSDAGGYRKDTENGSDQLTDSTHGSKSSWWKVYQSNEFIVNAFRYANHYAPSSLELYYNDYNECGTNKCKDIVTLLKAVKEHETDAVLPTRISAMGMQSHYNTEESPTIAQFESAAKAYAQIVGKVQMTETDLKASSSYDGTKSTREAEYTKEAYRYKEIFDSVKKLEAEGVDFGGITFWGVIDGNSWLQSRSSVGGGADGSQAQVPLLFDDDYKAKPAFYAFVDASKLAPLTKSINIIQSLDGSYKNGTSYTLGETDASAEFIPVWEEGTLKIQVTVKDTSVDASDEVIAYLDLGHEMKDGASIQKFSVKRSQAKEITGGYQAEIVCDGSFSPANAIGLDVVMVNGTQKYAYNNSNMTQEAGSRYYASASLKPFMEVKKGSVTIDGKADEIWDSITPTALSIKGSSPKASAQMKALWDENYLYVLTQVTDPALDSTASAVHEKDSVETFIDENNHKASSYEADDKQFRINYKNEHSFNGTNCTEENVKSAVTLTADGYIVEAAYKWTEITPQVGTQIGFDVQVNDAANGSRIGTLNWYDATGAGWSSPAVFGTVTLAGDVVKKTEIASAKIKMTSKMDYTGSALEPSKVTVKDGKNTLKETAAGSSKDGYYIVCSDNVNAGTATVTFYGTGKYGGSVQRTFRIEQVKLKKSMFESIPSTALHNGSATPDVTGAFKGTTLLKDTDYTISWSHNTKAGKTATVTVKGTGNFKGTVKLKFKVTT